MVLDGNFQYEAVSESLKNVVLVMNAADILVPPSQEDQRDEQRALWTATQARLDRFLPGFLTEVIPTPEMRPSTPVVVSTPATPVIALPTA